MHLDKKQKANIIWFLLKSNWDSSILLYFSTNASEWAAIHLIPEAQHTEGKTEMTPSYLVTHVICHIRTLLSVAHSIGLVRDEHRFSHLALRPALILGTLQIQLNHMKLEVLLTVEHLGTNVCLFTGVGYEPGRFFCL